MKRLIAASAAIILFAGCQPAVRYSPVPPGPRVSHQSKPATQRTTADVELDKSRLNSVIKSYMGTPYRSGGYGKLGIDCSGLVYAVYRDYAGLHLPPSTKKLFNGLERVSYRDLNYGDLVFFSINGKHASHVGIFVGDDKFVHASKSRGVVLGSLTDKYYRQTFVGARRVLG